MAKIKGRFPGENVLVMRQCTQEMLFTDAQIMQSLEYLSERTKVNIIKHIIKITGQRFLFHNIFYDSNRAQFEELIKLCEQEREKFNYSAFSNDLVLF